MNLYHKFIKHSEHRPFYTSNAKNIVTINALNESSNNCTPGKITQVLYEVGGQYRRNM